VIEADHVAPFEGKLELFADDLASADVEPA
jgi:hypothetical protein